MLILRSGMESLGYSAGAAFSTVAGMFVGSFPISFLKDQALKIDLSLLENVAASASVGLVCYATGHLAMSVGAAGKACNGSSSSVLKNLKKISGGWLATSFAVAATVGVWADDIQDRKIHTNAEIEAFCGNGTGKKIITFENREMVLDCAPAMK